MGRDLVAEYFNEPILYGGLICTRAEAIGDMQEQGLPERCIDRYMSGVTPLAEMSGPTVVVGADEYPGEIWGPIGITAAARGEGPNEKSIAHYFEAALAGGRS